MYVCVHDSGCCCCCCCCCYRAEGLESVPHRAPVAGGSSGGAAAALGGAAAAGGDPLQALRNHPQINQLRAMVQSNPSALPMVLQQIGAASPQLLEIITAVRGLWLHVQCP